MSTKKPVADPDIEPEYDFRGAVPNPYAERYPVDHVPVVTRTGGPSGSTRGPRARAARVRGTTLIVSLMDGREVRVPIAWFPRLLAGSVAARTNLRMIEDGRALHWPDLDEDVGVAGLLAAAGS
ncbi:MAG TPA: DUF2442 domain-containing protein [Candidatus Limnocylindrales bacterium]